jgi:hypothetical protein
VGYIRKGFLSRNKKLKVKKQKIKNMLFFENKVGNLVDFEKTVVTTDPNQKTGTLFNRDGVDDFYFKVNIILQYFHSNPGFVLRHQEFLNLVAEAQTRKDRVLKRREEQEAQRLEEAHVEERIQIVSEVLEVLKKDYVNMNLVIK